MNTLDRVNPPRSEPRNISSTDLQRIHDQDGRSIANASNEATARRMSGRKPKRKNFVNSW